MKIAICDDEWSYGENLKRLIAEYSKDLDWEIELYSDGNELLKKDLDEYQLVFLDIEMPTIDGMQLANQIAAKSLSILIIYTTNYIAYVTTAIRNHAFQFLPKPIIKEDLILELDRVREVIHKRQYKLKISWKNTESFLNINEILFIEINNKTTKIVMTNGKSYFSSIKLCECLETLKKYDFAQTHKSYLVNLDRVTSIERDQLVLDKDVIIAISRRYKDQFRKIFNLYSNGITIC